MLDKSYAWKFDPSRWFFDPEPGIIDQHVGNTASELLTIYIIMAQVQDATLSLSKNLITESRFAQSTLHHSTGLLLMRMDEVRQRIEQVRHLSVLLHSTPFVIRSLQKQENSPHPNRYHWRHRPAGRVSNLPTKLPHSILPIIQFVPRFCISLSSAKGRLSVLASYSSVLLVRNCPRWWQSA